MSFWLQHAPVLSVVLPMLTAVVLLLIGDPGGMAGRHQPVRPAVPAALVRKPVDGTRSAVSAGRCA